MGDFKGRTGKTKVGMVLQSLGRSDILEKVVNATGSAITGDFLGAVKTLITKDDKLTQEQKEAALEVIKIDENDLKALKLENEDRKRATDLFKADSILQKIYALAFLTFYFILLGFLLWGLYNWVTNGIKPDAITSTIVGGIEGRLSMKVSTITDFLFGGSIKKDTK